MVQPIGLLSSVDQDHNRVRILAVLSRLSVALMEHRGMEVAKSE